MLATLFEKSNPQPTSLEIGKADARKRLRWLVKNPPDGSVSATITPELAQFILDEYNDGNRPLSPGSVAAYAREMKDGHWQYTGEPIIFADTGVLNDGQHRLAACVKSGASFHTDIKFGIPRKAFAVTDIGKRRSAGDIFAINGVPHYHMAAATSLWLWRYDRGMVRLATETAPTPEELYDFYLTKDGLQKSFTPGERFSRAKISPPSIMAAMHYLCALKNRQMADTFFEKAATGIGITKTDIAGKLRKRLIEGAISGARLDTVYIAAFTVKAWNALRRGERVQVLRWRGENASNESFPKVI